MHFSSMPTTVTKSRVFKIVSKSVYQDQADSVKAKLDAVSPTMCLAKWNQVSLHLPTGMTNSCYHPPLHRIDAAVLDDNPAALHNTAEKQQQRAMMLAGTRPAGCEYCWKLEDAGGISDRVYRSGEPWAEQDYDLIVGNPHNPQHVPRYVEVNFNHACNLRCSYCSPQFSTSWGQEVKKQGGYPTVPEHNAPEHFAGDRTPVPAKDHNPYVDAFWKWWPDLYPSLKHFRMTGGEPMMDKNTYRVFDYILDNPKKDLHVNVTSNFSPADHSLKQKYFSYVKRICLEETVEHFMQFVSVDAWGSKAEYIRDGLDFNYMMDNVEEFLEDIPHRNSVTFIITYNNLSVTSIQQLLQKIQQLRETYSSNYQRVWFDIPLLRQPAWQQVTLLPEAYQEVHQQAISWMKLNQGTDMRDFRDFEIEKMTRNLNYWKQNITVDVDTHKNFHRFFSEHDRRRGTNFLTTFPEMREFWHRCASL